MRDVEHKNARGNVLKSKSTPHIISNVEIQYEKEMKKKKVKI